MGGREREREREIDREIERERSISNVTPICRRICLFSKEVPRSSIRDFIFDDLTFSYSWYNFDVVWQRERQLRARRELFRR